jgi:hypothetical protein
MAVRHTAYRELLVMTLLAGVTMVRYWGTGPLSFVNYDDNLYVTDNVHVQERLSKESLEWAFKSMYATNWHPLTWVSHLVDYELYRLNPSGHHLTNLIIHIGNVVLLFRVLQTMTAAVWRRGLVAGLFAVHPLNVESVAWVAERKRFR